MSLFEKVENDIKAAMLAKEKEKLEALRAIKAAFLLAKTEKGASETLSEDTELKVIQKLVKQRKESAELYRNGGRNELADSEMFQAEVISQYLPAGTSALVRDVLNEVRIASHNCRFCKHKDNHFCRYAPVSTPSISSFLTLPRGRGQ